MNIRMLKAIGKENEVIILGINENIDTVERRKKLIDKFPSSEDYSFIMGEVTVEDHDAFVFYLPKFTPFPYVAVEWSERNRRFMILQEENTYSSANYCAKHSYVWH